MIARLVISLVLTREGTITLDDRDSVVALVHLVLLPMLQPVAMGAANPEPRN